MALPAFLIFGSRTLPRPRQPAQLGPSIARGTDAWAMETIVALGQPAPAPYSDLNVHRDGRQALQALLGTIDGAESSIDLCTFIIGRDPLGTAVIDALAGRPRKGYGSGCCWTAWAA